jgi:hypothetical protein
MLANGTTVHQVHPGLHIVDDVLECGTHCAPPEVELLIELLVRQRAALLQQAGGRPGVVSQKAVEQVHGRNVAGAPGER